ncbi:hypothetical protein HPB51_001482 [Rhipicephalus microplus]|uniref:Uncharacterized protein n=1 Tax=Rhipicephalus microplus TaxID=6941 RepID=A0A9J6DSA9_RHIMP|nr:hypothetical protein HPB51_001482 [Rhipicephalus microplus]
MFTIYAAAIHEKFPLLRNLERGDLHTLTRSDQLSFLQDTLFQFLFAFPLNVSNDLVEQSLKQQNFFSLYHLLNHLSSHNGLRYIEHRLPVIILPWLRRLPREGPCYFKQLVETTFVGVMNEDDQRVVEVLCQQAHLRLVTQCPLNVPDHAQVQVTEKSKEFHNSTFPFRLSRIAHMTS